MTEDGLGRCGKREGLVVKVVLVVNGEVVVVVVVKFTWRSEQDG